MSKRLFVLGLDARATTFALRLRDRAELTLVADAADELVAFGGATTFRDAADVANVAALLAPLDDALVFGRARVVTALGVVRDVDVRPARALAFPGPKRVLCVGFAGWREWSAARVADGLRSAGVPAEAVNVQLFGAAPDASWPQMRERLMDTAFRGELVDALKPKLDGRALVLMPPLLGETTTGLSMTQALGNECGIDPARVGEAIATAPALFGERHAERVARALMARSPISELADALKDGDVHVFTTRAKGWLSARASSKVTFHGAAIDRRLARLSFADAWVAGLRDAEAVERSWAL